MVDEFQARVCDENLWNNNPKNVYESSVFSPIITEIGSFNWPADFMDMKARSSEESDSANNSEGSIIFQEIQKPIDQKSGYGDRSLWMDSNFDMISSGLSSSITTDWNQTLMHGSKGDESNYQSFFQEDLNLSSSSCQQDVTIEYSQSKKDWRPKNLSTIDEDSSMNAFKETNDHQDFPLSSYGYATSSLLQTLFDDISDSPPQDSIFGNQTMDYASTKCSSELSPVQRPSLPKEEPLSHLNLSNPITLWNSSSMATNDIRASCFSQVQSQIFPPVEDKSNFSNLSNAAKSNNDSVRDLSSVVKKNNSSEPAYKRPRIETPSPLPTFKVRKEKLGDRITALQQLVSPFGKTDTASVLHEAIAYIKLLHDQVKVLSTPYMKSGSFVQCEQMLKRSNGTQVLGVKNQNLRTRGLCLVPISSTFPVTTDTTADFWTPTFGATLR